MFLYWLTTTMVFIGFLPQKLFYLSLSFICNGDWSSIITSNMLYLGPYGQSVLNSGTLTSGQGPCSLSIFLMVSLSILVVCTSRHQAPLFEGHGFHSRKAYSIGTSHM